MKPIIELLLSKAIEAGASDLHFIPKQTNIDVQVRSNMKLASIQTMSWEQYERLTSYMRYWCALTEVDQRAPQSGIFETDAFAIRVTFLPSFQHVSMSWRLPTHTFQLNRLLKREDVQRLQDTMSKQRGLFLIGGATGAGKTTILYALLESLKEKRIITIENPPEQELEGVIQLEVNNRADRGYRSLLKETLRADPDIIVIGEVRTDEELRVAYDAALSGHLTLTTFHTGSVEDGERRVRQFLSGAEIERNWCVLTRSQEVTCEWATIR